MIEEILGSIIDDGYENVSRFYVTEEQTAGEIARQGHEELKRFHDKYSHRIKFAKGALDLTYGLRCLWNQEMVIIEMSLNNKAAGFEYGDFRRQLSSHYSKLQHERVPAPDELRPCSYGEIFKIRPSLFTVGKRRGKATIMRVSYSLNRSFLKELTPHRGKAGLMSENVGYAVLLAAPEDLQVAPLAKALAIFKKIPLQDAARLARNSRGFVGEHLSEEKARELVSRLADCGIGCLVMAQASIQELAQTQTVSGLEVRRDALRLTDKAGLAETIPSSSLVVVAAAGIKVPATDTVKTREGPAAAARALRAGVMMATGIPLPIGRKKRKTQKKETTSKILFYLDLVTREPDARYRIDAQNFDYSFLKKRMLHHSFGNFNMLLSDVIKIAPGALHNRGTSVIMNSQPISTMDYGSFADFHRESQWLWNLTCSQ